MNNFLTSSDRAKSWKQSFYYGIRMINDVIKWQSLSTMKYLTLILSPLTVTELFAGRVIVKRKTCGDTRRQDEKWKDSSAAKWLGARLMCQLSTHRDCPLFCWWRNHLFIHTVSTALLFTYLLRYGWKNPFFLLILWSEVCCNRYVKKQRA